MSETMDMSDPEVQGMLEADKQAALARIRAANEAEAERDRIQAEVEAEAEAEVVGDDISDWVWKDGIKYPGGDGTVWVSEYAPMRVWELQAALARLNPTDHVLIAAPCDSRSEWLNIGMVVAPNGPDPQNVSAVTLFPGLEWDSFDMAIDWDSRADRGLFR